MFWPFNLCSRALGWCARARERAVGSVRVIHWPLLVKCNRLLVKSLSARTLARTFSRTYVQTQLPPYANWWQKKTTKHTYQVSRIYRFSLISTLSLGWDGMASGGQNLPYFQDPYLVGILQNSLFYFFKRTTVYVWPLDFVMIYTCMIVNKLKLALCKLVGPLLC